MRYIVEYDTYQNEPGEVEVEAESVSKAKYAAFKKLIEDGILVQNAQFIIFLKYILCRVWTEEEWRAWNYETD